MCWAIWERSQDRLNGYFTSMVSLSSKGISELRMIRGDGNVFGFDDIFWVFIPLPPYLPSPLKMEECRTLLNRNENVWHLIPVVVVIKTKLPLEKTYFLKLLVSFFVLKSVKTLGFDPAFSTTSQLASWFYWNTRKPHYDFFCCSIRWWDSQCSVKIPYHEFVILWLSQKRK